MEKGLLFRRSLCEVSGKNLEPRSSLRIPQSTQSKPGAPTNCILRRREMQSVNGNA